MKSVNANSVTRRATALLLGASMLGLGLGGAMAQDAIKIGIVTPKQGPSASIGTHMAQGAELAVKLHGGKLLGKPVETIWLDESSPQIAQQNMQKLADEYKVAGVVGGNSSAAALAMMSVAEREKIPFVSAGASASEITGEKCNRYTFRSQATAPVQTEAALKLLQGKKIYFITPAYAFGQDVLASGRRFLDKFGATEVGADEVPLNTADYSSYILKIRQAKPDVVFGALVGLDLSNFMKQWNEMGMKGSIPIYEVAVSDTDFWDIGPAAATGTHIKPWYYMHDENTESERKFTEAYIATYGQPPADKAFFGWFSMKALLDSIEAAGSAEPKDVVLSLEKWRYTEGKFPYYYRDFDHQLIRPAVVVSLKDPITDEWDFMNVDGWTSQTLEETEAAFGAREQTKCVMGEP